MRRHPAPPLRPPPPPPPPAALLDRALATRCSGANFPLDLQTPPKAHAVRLLFQSVLLAMFWEISQPTILDFKSNMGLM
mgnify:CR=1 FL=1